MMILIQLKLGLNNINSSIKLIQKSGSQEKISFHTLKEAQVEMPKHQQQVDLVRNNPRQNQVVNQNQFLQVKDIVIQNSHWVLKTLETVSTFIFHFIV